MTLILLLILLVFLPPIFTGIYYAVSFLRAPEDREVMARRRWAFLKRSNGVFFLSLILGLIIVMTFLPESISSALRILLSILFIAVAFLLQAWILGIADRKIRGIPYSMMGYMKFQTFFFAARFLALFVVLVFLYYPFFQGPLFEGIFYDRGGIGGRFYMDMALLFAAAALFVLTVLFQVRLMGRVTGVLIPLKEAGGEGGISGSILKLAEKAGIAREKIDLFVIETFGYPYFNAFAAPLKSIYFTRPLLKELEGEDILAVSAHEIGHLLSIKRRTVSAVLLYLGFALFLWLLTPIFSAFATGNLLLSAAVIAVFLLFFLFIVFFRRMSQRFETAADEIAASLTGDPMLLVKALEKIYELNMIPRRFDKRGSEEESHPSLERRVATLKGEKLDRPKRSVFRIIIWSVFFVVLLIFLANIFKNGFG
ncbi:MAG: M48 family metalloprotease [Deltaproteobacteria bacterium]|uniref:M48 family metalloprotease n=1 Tax=Candidatus Zymogenus saltonus TaxID=2844893 RepID=A0A9D8KI13_9DELT|nr:M48 family metalloprotease [Candidatus Zymogenus saltonus]